MIGIKHIIELVCSRLKLKFTKIKNFLKGEFIFYDSVEQNSLLNTY